MKPICTKNRAIGILGGSFNPAHAGHLHISLYALKKYKLDCVWWLVSPQNPLKDAKSLADYDKRLASARSVAAAHPRIIVSDMEQKMGTKYSHQTITLLKKQFPGAHFVWLMGADNLAGFHRWQRWRQIFALLPVVVLDRAPYSHTALHTKAVSFAHKFTRQSNQIAGFADAPSFHFVHMRKNPLSATAIRKTLGKKA
ncbi:MAG: nicotinate (nicotinamide) nucleotide adenylyltransferase, partial [Alphaproteobacteria bacterium]|nr:nicotinate (nicotinamide) nucleotide adenylyltransferase [Alphaproteobacteria bacterium]